MNEIDFNSIPSDLTPSPERIDEMHRNATDLPLAFSRRIESLIATFAEARDRYSRDAETFAEGAGTDATEKRVAQQLAKRRLAQQVSNFRMTLVQSSEAERADMLRQLNTLAEDAAHFAALHATPVQYLGRFALGDSRRLGIQQTLEQAGPVELENAARLAIMSNDLRMAAAIVTVVDRRGRDRRPFNPMDFAARVVGVEHAEIAAKLTAIQVAAQGAFAAEREFIRGKPDPLTNVSLALTRRGLAKPADAQPKEV